ncbi:MAG: hypothetical protein SPI13_06575, partial [Eubacteriales bacterium]|nr:hypothetical protein [Eubacteriales bacterium]
MKNLSVFVNSVNKNELMEMVRAYQAYVNFSYEKTDGFDEYFYSDEITDDKIIITSTICGKTTVEEYDLPNDTLNKKKFARRFGKRSIYKTLKEYSGEWLPYGCLTGVRPTKLYAELLREGIDAKGEFTGFFDVTPEKAEHVARIVKNQEKLLKIGKDEVDVFVNIPFCPTRCAYCSFVAVSMKQLRKYLESYVETLKNEISIIKNVINENNFKVRAV